ncbi:MAG: hypothetical protein ACUVUE_01560 [Candidatus Bathycorpusculaceae bacterium]
MFKGEKTSVFWADLILLGLASTVLFAIVWFNALLALKIYPYAAGIIEFQAPFIVAAIVFFLIVLYMMRSGVKKTLRERANNTAALNFGS